MTLAARDTTEIYVSLMTALALYESYKQLNGIILSNSTVNPNMAKVLTIAQATLFNKECEAWLDVLALVEKFAKERLAK